jgi:hypothetical protein
MTQSTQHEAFVAFRMLRDVNAGRLRGQSLARYVAPIPTGTLDEAAAATLRANQSRRPGTPLSADAIVYVISCDGTPIVWVTRELQVTTPAAALSDYQRRQQTRATQALAGVSRHAVRSLAALADHADGRPEGGSGTPADDAGPHVLVADSARPTLTHWARISADPAVSLAHLRAITGATDGRVLIVAAAGYGGYGTHAAVLDLDVLCALEQIAHATSLPAEVVGAWLHAESGSTCTRLSAERLPADFRASYAGAFPGLQAFAAAERDTRGWTAALHSAGIPLVLFDLRRFAQQVFDTDAYPIPMPDGRTAVFYRATRPEAR